MILKEIFISEANIKPEYGNKILNLKLHLLSNNRYN